MFCYVTHALLYILLSHFFPCVSNNRHWNFVLILLLSLCFCIFLLLSSFFCIFSVYISFFFRFNFVNLLDCLYPACSNNNNPVEAKLFLHYWAVEGRRRMRRTERIKKKMYFSLQQKEREKKTNSTNIFISSILLSLFQIVWS